MSNRQALLTFVFGVLFLALLVFSSPYTVRFLGARPWFALPITEAEAATTVNVLKPISQSDGWTCVDWPYTADADGTISATTDSRVFGILWRVYHEPSTTAPICDTWAVTVNEGFGYGGGWYATDIASGLSIGGTNTASLEAFAVYPTKIVPVASKLKFNMTGAHTQAGDPASGRLIFMFAPK